MFAKAKNYKEHLPPHSSKANNNKYGRLGESFCGSSLNVVHLYDYRILYEFLLYNNLYSFIHSFSNPLIPVQGCWWLQPIPAVQGTSGNQPWTRCHSTAQHTHIHTHIHTHSCLDNLDTSINLMCTSLGCRRKLEYLEKTHADMGRMCKLHTVAPARNQFCFSHQCYSETMLSEDLLYVQTSLVPRLQENGALE